MRREDFNALPGVPQIIAAIVLALVGCAVFNERGIPQAAVLIVATYLAVWGFVVIWRETEIR